MDFDTIKEMTNTEIILKNNNVPTNRNIINKDNLVNMNFNRNQYNMNENHKMQQINNHNQQNMNMSNNIMNNNQQNMNMNNNINMNQNLNNNNMNLNNNMNSNINHNQNSDNNMNNLMININHNNINNNNNRNQNMNNFNLEKKGENFMNNNINKNMNTFNNMNMINNINQNNMNNNMNNKQFISMNNMNNINFISKKPSIDNINQIKSSEMNNKKIDNYFNQNINNNNNMNNFIQNNNNINNNNIIMNNNYNNTNNNNIINNNFINNNNINNNKMINNMNNINSNNINMNNMNFINNLNMNNINNINLNNPNNMLQINNNQNQNNFIQNINMNSAVINQKFKQNININSIKAVIQCLNNFQEITKYLLNPSKYNELITFHTNFPITSSFAKIINSFQNPLNFNNKYIDNLKDIIDRSNNLYSSNPKDIFIFMIESIHKELKVPFEPNNNFNKNNIGNKVLLYNNFINNIFNPENTSIISKNCFCGREMKAQCNICTNINYEYDIIKCIEFSIEEIYSKQVDKAKKLLIDNQNKGFNYLMNKMNQKKISINDLFDYYINFFQQNNNYFCHNCNSNTNCIFCYRFIILPNILCLILKRESKINIKVDLKEDFDISNFTSPQVNIAKKQYELIGIISYLEENNTYLTMLKNKNDSQWYKYKDDNVSKISFIEAKDNNGTPYMLFYQNI